MCLEHNNHVNSVANKGNRIHEFINKFSQKESDLETKQ